MMRSPRVISVPFGNVRGERERLIEFGRAVYGGNLRMQMDMQECSMAGEDGEGCGGESWRPRVFLASWE